MSAGLADLVGALRELREAYSLDCLAATVPLPNGRVITVVVTPHGLELTQDDDEPQDGAA